MMNSPDVAFDPGSFPGAPSSEAFINQYVPKDDDRGVHAEFYLYPVLQGKKSHDAGREIYEDKEYVRIQVKGNDKMIVERQATEQDLKRFPYQYQQFKKGEQQRRIGTPIARLGLGPSQILSFQSLGVFTIEDMAEVTDTNLSNFGIGARELREKAKGIVSGSAQGEELSKLKEMVEKQSEELAKALNLCTKLTAENERLRAPRRGRPPRVEKPAEG